MSCAKFVISKVKQDSYWVVYDDAGSTVFFRTIREIVGEVRVDRLFSFISSKSFGRSLLHNIDVSGPIQTLILMNNINWDDFYWDDEFFNFDEELPDTIKEPAVQPKVKPKGKVGDGMICMTCKNYYPFVEPNQKDGSFMCYKCRNNL